VTAPVTYEAKMDAEAWLIDERRLAEKPESWVAPKARLEQARRAEAAARRPPFRDYANEWLETRRNSRGEPLRPTTRDKYLSNLRVHIFPAFGDTPLNEITRDAVRAWHRSLGVGPSASADAYNLFRSILETAVEDDELLAKNPVSIRGAGVKGSRKRVRPATLDELALMVDAMPERRRLLLLLATWCALRSGELRELRRSDIKTTVADDGQAIGWVQVRRAVTQAKVSEAGEGRRTASVVGEPKTAAGVRDVSIPSFLVPDVQQHLDKHVGPDPDSLLFSSERDPKQHLSQSTLNGRAAEVDGDGVILKAGFGWREARRAAGREDLDLHDLRHTGASMAGEEGASIAELMHRLGHSTPAMAMRYQHSTRDRDQDLARKLSTRAEMAAQRTPKRPAS
jgi:integrase